MVAEVQPIQCRPRKDNLILHVVKSAHSSSNSTSGVESCTLDTCTDCDCEKANTIATALLAKRPMAIMRANAATAALLALRPLQIVRAKATATTLLAARPSFFVGAKIQMFKDVTDGSRVIQGMPRTFLPERLPAGLVTIMRNHGKSSSILGMCLKPTGPATFCAVRTFQRNNEVRGFINRWQTPNAIVGAIHALSEPRPILGHLPGSPHSEDFRCVI